MNTVTITVDINPESREEFVQAVRSVTENLKNEKGFKRSGLFQDMDNPNRFNLTEEWETQDDLDSHVQSDIFRVLMGALKVLAEHAEVRYNLISDKSGKRVVDI